MAAGPDETGARRRRRCQRSSGGGRPARLPRSDGAHDLVNGRARCATRRGGRSDAVNRRWERRTRMKLALITLLPFLGAVFPVFSIRSGRNACASLAAAFTLAALVLLLTEAPAVYRGEVPAWGVEWLAPVGLRFSFFVDGLGLFFAALILGIGLLIILYARFYLDRRDPMGVFYTYLLLFQGAMVGIALSNNVLMMLVFWELTSLSSFLLIGYWRHLPEARQGARMALAVTGGGGLCLIAGMLLLGHIAGSYELTEILARGDIKIG